MAGRGRSYREKRRKEVVAPSGDEFTIRKPGARSITKQLKGSGGIRDTPEDIEYALSDEGMKESAKEALEQQTPEELITSMDALILECVVDPKVVNYETDEDDKVWIGDIEMADYFFLFREITDFAGVTAEKLRELFRDLGIIAGAAGGEDSNLSEPKA